MDLSIKVVIGKNYLGLPSIEILHWANILIHYVEKPAKNCMRYLEFHNIYHNTKRGFYLKLLMSQFNYCPFGQRSKQ